jgi:probable phosphoglycerate mutase
VLECLYRWARQAGFGQPRDFDIFNASINRLHWDGEHLHIRQWADISHLQHLALDEVDR